jgi:ubiquinone/menaquinone biosynthesis C-methylase UbiE
MRGKNLNKSYSKLKTQYQSRDIVRDYEEIRFQNVPGRIFEYFQKKSISNTIDKLEGVSMILDLPCGTGRLTRLLSDKGYKVVGFDISEAMLRYASQRMDDNCKLFALGSAENLCFKDYSFDCVISFRFFCHLDSDVRVQTLKEMKRVSKRWIIITNAYLTPHTRLRRQFKKTVGLSYGHWRPVRFPYTRDTVNKEIRAAGLKLSKIAWTNRILSEEAYFILEKV